jgi:hypothetical protein
MDRFPLRAPPQALHGEGDNSTSSSVLEREGEGEKERKRERKREEERGSRGTSAWAAQREP